MMGARLKLGVWLTVVWVALWGDVSAANIVGGMLVAAVVIAAAPNAGPHVGVSLHPWQAARFFGYFGLKLIEANLVVAWQVLSLGAKVREGIVEVRLRQADDTVTTLVADAVTLTPGTLTVEVASAEDGMNTLYVHVLHLTSVESVRSDVLKFEELIAAAFGGPQTRQAVGT